MGQRLRAFRMRAFGGGGLVVCLDGMGSMEGRCLVFGVWCLGGLGLVACLFRCHCVGWLGWGNVIGVGR